MSATIASSLISSAIAAAEAAAQSDVHIAATHSSDGPVEDDDFDDMVSRTRRTFGRPGRSNATDDGTTLFENKQL